MAKRRNLKKEKALRNQAYARKFRKRTNSGRYNRRRPDDRQEENTNSDGEKTTNEDGTAKPAGTTTASD
ncbi:hypothetical protein IQ266_17330 [filamentous cyanobacterium LEGE 11480]|uniref:Uncharacterized protein n=1 Tax=Romeriopsis navalis LEGE 11480 TaxID=2777977 RepID=A0A928VPR2_9CYAN|nr:hypothetical protein [Romeriopsis navalis]MBE9031497.1 hypothetical protein [Romeriopsis navalis LEGE 11480]